MIPFLLGFGTGLATLLGLLIIEEWLETASLRDEGTTDVESQTWAAA